MNDQDYNPENFYSTLNISKAHPFDAGFDIPSNETFTIPAMSSHLFSTNLFVNIPIGSYGRVASRSGLAVKHGIEVGAGVIDHGYTGEVKVLLRNFSSVDYTVTRGDKIAQLIIQPCFIGEPVFVQSLPNNKLGARGANGFGSSGI